MYAGREFWVLLGNFKRGLLKSSIRIFLRGCLALGGSFVIPDEKILLKYDVILYTECMYNFSLR